ncbi:hypothetical protein HYN48_00900 [Flavobacterium magnum]|uniref:Uncharacterized protein n=1 Tax=Flavobacterium magnum TaxID=2162713 RepID=A0A2S0RCC4_9FLAO|nr:hypothetical protein [Flavobacterium magnum]AWA28761.1 hypothetical protein HYN48_00900 [Flavobacterium magnum]
MTPFLLILLLVNLALIAIVSADFRKSKKAHKLKTAAYESMIVTLLENQATQQGRVQMADDLKETLRTSQKRIGEEILSLQYQLIDTLAKNNLIE